MLKSYQGPLLLHTRKSQTHHGIGRSALFGSTTVTHVKILSALLEKIQHRSARFIYQNFHRNSIVTQMMTQFGWGSLVECCAKRMMMVLYRAVHGLGCIPIGYVRPTLAPVMSAIRGNTVQFIIPYYRTITMQQFFFSDTARVQNSLSPDVPQSLESYEIRLHDCPLK